MPLSLLILVVRWGKSKCAAKRWLCEVGCSSFDFAEALAFCCSFFLFDFCRSCRLLGLHTTLRNIDLHYTTSICLPVQADQYFILDKAGHTIVQNHQYLFCIIWLGMA
jgi:hypothetical protein